MAPKSSNRLLAYAITGAVLAALSLFFWWQLASNPAVVQPRGRDPGPAFQPGIALALLGLCGLWLAASSLWQLRRQGGATPGAFRQLVKAELAKLPVPAAMVASLLVFVWLAPVAGFLVTSILFTVGWAAFLAWQDIAAGGRRGIVVAALGALAAAGLLYVAFRLVIGVPL